MSLDETALANLLAKDEIRELAMLYSRGVDRKDAGLLSTLYTRDGTDTHGAYFDGSATDFVDFLAQGFPHFPYSGHHICNHLISVDGEAGEGEVYALAYHVHSDAEGGFVENLMGVRYMDRYRKEDGRWRFAKRVVAFDFQSVRPIPGYVAPAGGPGDDLSYATLVSRLFARGPRG